MAMGASSSAPSYGIYSESLLPSGPLRNVPSDWRPHWTEMADARLAEATLSSSRGFKYLKMVMTVSSLRRSIALGRAAARVLAPEAALTSARRRTTLTTSTPAFEEPRAVEVAQHVATCGGGVIIQTFRRDTRRCYGTRRVLAADADEQVAARVEHEVEHVIGLALRRARRRRRVVRFRRGGGERRARGCVHHLRRGLLRGCWRGQPIVLCAR